MSSKVVARKGNAVKEYLKEDMAKKETAAATAHARGGALFQSTRFQALPQDSDKIQTKLIQYRLMQNIITAPDDQNKNLAHVRMALEKSLTLSVKSHDVDATFQAKYGLQSLMGRRTNIVVTDHLMDRDMLQNMLTRGASHGCGPPPSRRRI